VPVCSDWLAGRVDLVVVVALAGEAVAASVDEVGGHGLEMDGVRCDATGDKRKMQREGAEGRSRETLSQANEGGAEREENLIGERADLEREECDLRLWRGSPACLRKVDGKRKGATIFRIR
jgi:hypothetical protein